MVLLRLQFARQGSLAGSTWVEILACEAVLNKIELREWLRKLLGEKLG